MSKITEIKERLKNASGEYGWYVMHDTDITYEEPAGSCDEHQVCYINNIHDAEFVGNAKDDISYLLSKLEIAQKALEEFVDKHFHGGSKSNRDDYVAWGVPTADIFKLKQTIDQLKD